MTKKCINLMIHELNQWGFVNHPIPPKVLQDTPQPVTRTATKMVVKNWANFVSLLVSLFGKNWDRDPFKVPMITFCVLEFFFVIKVIFQPLKSIFRLKGGRHVEMLKSLETTFKLLALTFSYATFSLFSTSMTILALKLQFDHWYGVQ